MSKITAAASKGTHLVVLPEYHLTSWAPEDPGFVASCTESVSYLPRYQTLARELQIHIVPGTIIHPVHARSSTVECPRDGEAEPVLELRNLMHFIAASTGNILSTYQKKNLWHTERGVLTADYITPHQAFDVPLSNGGVVRVGMLICWDLAFPEAFRGLAADGAQLIIIPAYWMIDTIDAKVLAINQLADVTFLDSVTVARAYENTCAIAFCNAWGQSQVAMPILGSLGKVGVGEDNTIISNIDLSVISIAEDHYRLKADIRSAGWHYSK